MASSTKKFGRYNGYLQEWLQARTFQKWELGLEVVLSSKQ
jgi:hypothetical protein